MVIAIIAILIGLLLPAVQKVRESASRMTCANNLKPISLAALNYESANGYLPPGIVSTPGVGSQTSYVGTLPFLLPYLEQDNLYAQIDRTLFNLPPAKVSGIWWGTSYGPAQTSVKGFLCPSDSLAAAGQPVTGVWAFITTSGNATTSSAFGVPSPLGRTNYASVSGTFGDTPDPFYGQWVGAYTPNSRTRVVAITDGTSNTFGFGETFSGSNPGARDYASSWMGGSNLPTAYGLPTNADWRMFGSAHSGVVNFGYCDGSVRTGPQVLRPGVGLLQPELVRVPAGRRHPRRRGLRPQRHRQLTP